MRACQHRLLLRPLRQTLRSVSWFRLAAGFTRLAFTLLLAGWISLIWPHIAAYADSAADVIEATGADDSLVWPFQASQVGQ